jgi:hypothetical protein
MLKRCFGRGRKPAKAGRSSEPETTGWLPGYSGQTTDALIALADRYRADSIVLAFELALVMKAGRIGRAKLSEPERVILAVEAIEREVNSDGFDGLLRHGSNEHAAEFEPALTAIGRSDVAELARDALATLRLTGRPTAEAITRAMDREDDIRDVSLSALDARYYALAGDLAPSLLSFIRTNRDEIVLPTSRSPADTG